MVKLRALGESVIEIGDARLGPDAEMLFALLTYFIVERGRPISRGELIGMFWPDQADARARHCLRQAVYKLRGMGVAIETRNDCYILPRDAATVDFENIAGIDAVSRLGTATTGTGVLPNFVPSASDGFREWLDQLRNRAAADIRRLLIQRLSDARSHNSWDECERLARKCLEIDPLNEEATLALAEATALGGNKQKAVLLLESYLAELGTSHPDIRLPAALLRKRIAERVSYVTAALAPNASFVGRATSLTLLQRIAREVADGTGYVCLVHGQPGIGKSRLLTEFANIAAMSGYRIVRGACRAGTLEPALALFMELAPQLLRLPGALGCAPEALSLVKRLSSIAAPNAAEELTHSDSRALHASLRASIRDLIDSVAGERPLIVLIEDIHWIDSHSWSVLREVAATNRHRQLMLLMTSRPTDTDRLMADWDSRQRVIHPLSQLDDEASFSLARDVSRTLGIESDESLVEWCVTHGTGNPLFITALLCHARDTNGRRQVPPSLEALLRERLRTLSREALRALQAVALLAEYATHGLVEAVLGLPRWQVLGVFEELERSGLLVSSVDSVRATHDLSALAAIEELTPTSSRILHRAIAEALSGNRDFQQDAMRLWRVATHWNEAGDMNRARYAALACASHLMSIGLATEAAAILDRARAFCDSDRTLRELLSVRIEALLAGGAFDDVIRVCRDVIQLDEKIHEVAAERHSREEIALIRADVGLHQSDPEALARAYSCASDTGAPLTHRLEAAMWGLAACYSSRNTEMARALVHIVLSLKPESVEDRRHVLNALIIHYADQGDSERGIVIGDELVALERQNGPALSLCRALRVSAFAQRHSGNWSVAEERLSEAASVAKQQKHVIYHAHAVLSMAQCALDQHEVDRAWKFVEEAETLLARIPSLVLPLLPNIGAEAAVLRGDVTNARRFVAQVTQMPSTPPRHESDRLALLLSLQMLVGDSPDPQAVDALHRLHLLLRGSTGQDFPTHVLTKALHHLGKAGEARVLAQEYLLCRKEKWTPRHQFDW
jgi:DNA-binding SARP family transcriptional activator